jgi:DNA-binding NarL/FixJ family response regulator
MSLRAVLIDDHTLFRRALRRLVAATPDIEVVAEAGDGEAALAAVRQHQPDVVVMDLVMPGLGGTAATRQILREFPRTAVLVLSAHRTRHQVIEALRAGATGYLDKSCDPDDLMRAIRTVAVRRTYLGPGIADLVVGEYFQRPLDADDAAGSKLTPREREVVRQLADGRNAKEIAADLGVALKTVETFRRQAMEKLGLKSVAELTKYAIRAGLSSID